MRFQLLIQLLILPLPLKSTEYAFSLLCWAVKSGQTINSFSWLMILFSCCIIYDIFWNLLNPSSLVLFFTCQWIHLSSNKLSLLSPLSVLKVDGDIASHSLTWQLGFKNFNTRFVIFRKTCLAPPSSRELIYHGVSIFVAFGSCNRRSTLQSKMRTMMRPNVSRWNSKSILDEWMCFRLPMCCFLEKYNWHYSKGYRHICTWDTLNFFHNGEDSGFFWNRVWSKDSRWSENRLSSWSSKSVQLWRQRTMMLQNFARLANLSLLGISLKAFM